jgi:hypothetical protein
MMTGGEQTPECGGTQAALQPESRAKGRARSYQESSRSIIGKEVRAMEGVLVVVGAIATFVGLGALVESALRRLGGTRREQVSP